MTAVSKISAATMFSGIGAPECAMPHWTQAADGPRYKALGNAMNVKEIQWVLQRIELFESLKSQDRPSW